MNNCAPHNKLLDNYTCFEHLELIELSNAFNMICQTINCKKITDINKKSKKELWISLFRRLQKICDNETCWISQDFLNLINDKKLLEKIKYYTFKPHHPKTMKTWLNTNDINNVLNQYQYKYTNFKFNGAVPSDFYKFVNIDYNKILNYDYVGYVINIDSSDKPGSHWVSLFIDNKVKTIEFFDSVGHVPTKNIKIFISNLQKNLGKRVNYKLLINRKIHQTKDVDCGVYSIHYIIQRLKNKSFKDITNNIIKDSKMNKYRNYIFRG